MNATATHTPGPWHTYGLPAQARILGPKGEAVAACRAKYRTREHAEIRDANARLIAAAPTMLAALRLCEQNLRERPTLTDADLETLGATCSAIVAALGTT